ncbi:MAG: type II toxin-antitoxin system PemK/MazF family toxin [Verrucomicrobia bacterium]|nr:type II toxin-antitoxin system PemK/MazF family toxin [Verrucomicrobiota bacterium]
MRQWDIFLFPFTLEQPHPVVILSSDERASARKHVNGLLCVTLRGRPLQPHEVLLDQADGLEWETAVRCDLVHLLERERFFDQRGSVSSQRQIQISRKLIECLRLRTY